MMRLGLGITRARGGDPIAALFAVAGRTGWRYPLTLDTLFQDAAGTTPVTAPGDPVGLVLDTSKGLALGANVLGSTWTFSTGATQSPAGTLNFPANGASAAQAGVVVAGKTYLVQFTATGSGNLNIHVGDPSAGAPDATVSTSGTYTFRIAADTVGTSFQFRSASSGGFVGSVTGYSVRELPGNHRTQSTALNRLTYQVDSNGKPYLAYNGSNSSMATASFAWGSDKATICVGVRKNNNTRGMILESSTGLLDGSFNIEASVPSGTENYAMTSRGTTNRSLTLSTFTAPITNVLTLVSDIAAPSLIARVNSAQAAISALTQGTGNFGTHAIYWGTRGSGGLFFNGREYPSIGINAALTASELASVEAWVTARTGALG